MPETTLAESFIAKADEIRESPTLPPGSGDIAPTELAGAPGIDRLIANMDGTVPPPPSWYALGWTLVAVESGRVEFAFTPLAAHTSYGGNVHGGILSALADSAMGCAVLSALPANHWCATIELKVNYLRGAKVPGPDLRASGSLRWLGSSTALAECTITAAEEEILVGNSTYAVRRDRRLRGQPNE